MAWMHTLQHYTHSVCVCVGWNGQSHQCFGKWYASFHFQCPFEWMGCSSWSGINSPSWETRARVKSGPNHCQSKYHISNLVWQKRATGTIWMSLCLPKNMIWSTQSKLGRFFFVSFPLQRRDCVYPETRKTLGFSIRLRVWYVRIFFRSRMFHIIRSLMEVLFMLQRGKYWITDPNTAQGCFSKPSKPKNKPESK